MANSSRPFDSQLTLARRPKVGRIGFPGLGEQAPGRRYAHRSERSIRDPLRQPDPPLRIQCHKRCTIIAGMGFENQSIERTIPFNHDGPQFYPPPNRDNNGLAHP